MLLAFVAATQGLGIQDFRLAWKVKLRRLHLRADECWYPCLLWDIEIDNDVSAMPESSSQNYVQISNLYIYCQDYMYVPRRPDMVGFAPLHRRLVAVRRHHRYHVQGKGFLMYSKIISKIAPTYVYRRSWGCAH